ncbi:TrkA family potassium uptake protein [Turicibacter bilis]|uniref:potassium channel family protein n=1 Tax=Turicibacter bilis TaxID=2735723 RepID=UPI0031BA5541
MKKKNTTFAVIGCGQFGGSVVSELASQGADVIAIDRNEDVIKKYINIATHTIVLDSTDEESLRSIGIRNVDHVIIGIGQDIQGSILTALLLKEIGVNKVTVKVVNDYHKKVILKIGVDNVIQPEKDTGKRLAHQMLSDRILDYIVLADNYSIIEILAVGPVIGHTLIELNIPTRFRINITAIKRQNGIIVPQANTSIITGDRLLVIGENKDLTEFNHWLLDD